jgi:hypothetical protein
MSTPAYVVFANAEGPMACIRRLSDGYPYGDQGVLAGLDRFFDYLDEKMTIPTPAQMYQRIEWLAAEYVHWCHKKGQRCMIERDWEQADAEHFYFMWSGELDKRGRPKISKGRPRMVVQLDNET